MDDNLRHKTLQHSPRSIFRQVNEQRLVVYPEFKGRKPWDDARRSQYIESIMLGMPAQPIWCEESKIGDHLIIDGSERINSIFDFLSGSLKLSKLRIRKEFEGFAVRDLPYHEVLNLQERFQISFVIVNYDAKPELKCEFYHRLLESEFKYKTQAARNFGYREGLSFLRELRQENTQYVKFEKARGLFSSQERFDSKVDEIFLYLILFISLERYITYVSSDFTVENLLDSLMDRLANNDPERKQWGIKINWILSRIADYYKHRVTVSIGSVAMRPEHLNIYQFYQVFIKSIDNATSDPSRHLFIPREIQSGAKANAFWTTINKIRHAQ